MADKMLTVIRIPANGDVCKVTIPHTLEAMQKLVGGYLDKVQVSDNTDLWLNDEGLLLHLPPNILASYATKRPIVGDCFLARFDSEGNTLSVTSEDLAEVGLE